MQTSTLESKWIGILNLLVVALIYSGFNSNAVSAETYNPDKELNRILKLLPKDNLRNGRVSYLDETFEDWLKRTGELPPDFSQLPSIPFLPDPLIVNDNGRTKKINNKKQWEEQREWMKQQLQYYVTGTVPPKPDNLKVKVLNEKYDGEVKIITVELSFGPQNEAKITAELMIPPGKGVFPVFLTQWTHHEWAYLAVRRGYIGCIYSGSDIFDDTEDYSRIWAGEYDFTRLMRRAYGASRVIDYLYTLPYVDKDKIGITGHSRNGKTSLMAAAFDERITACIPSSGGTGSEVPWRYSAFKYDVEDIALLSTAQPAWLHPRLRFFVGRENKLPVDQNFFTSLIAPRGLMLTTALNENASNIWGIEQLFKKSKEVYQFLKHEDNIAIHSREGLHGLNAKDIEVYIDFFDYIFKRKKIIPENKLYTDYIFEKWKRDTKGINHAAISENIGQQNYFDVFQNKMEQWQIHKNRINKNINWLLGETPAGVTNHGPKELDKGGAGEIKFGTFIKRPVANRNMKVMAVTPYDGFGDVLYGYLYYPANIVESTNTNIPVVIYLHEYDYSKGLTSMSFEHELNTMLKTFTDMGIGVFMFDMFGFGNRQKEAVNFYDRYPAWSKMGKMVTDTKAAVEAMYNLEFINKSGIYVLGYSLGGMVGLLTASQDDRVAGVASVAGFTPFRTNTLDRGTTGIMEYSHLHGLLPRLGFYVNKEDEIPVDFDEIISLIAPRELLVVAPALDQDAHVDDIRNCVNNAQTVFRLLDAASNIQLEVTDDYNRFAGVNRDVVYKWFKKILEKR